MSQLRVEGRVWRVVVSPERVRELGDRFPVASAVHRSDSAHVRLVAESPPIPDADPARPTLEDAYLWIMQGEGRRDGDVGDASTGRSGRAAVRTSAEDTATGAAVDFMGVTERARRASLGRPGATPAAGRLTRRPRRITRSLICRRGTSDTRIRPRS